MEHMNRIDACELKTYFKRISDDFFEVGVSMKSYIKDEFEFVLKKLFSYDIYLQIKPRRVSSHIFVSFMVPWGTTKRFYIMHLL